MNAGHGGGTIAPGSSAGSDSKNVNVEPLSRTDGRRFVPKVIRSSSLRGQLRWQIHAGQTGIAWLSSEGRAFLGSRTDLTTRGFASSLVTRASSAAFDSFFLGTIGDPERYTRFLVRFLFHILRSQILPVRMWFDP